jgi:hypothetical protein
VLLGLVLLLAVACVALGLTAREYADAFLPRTTVNGVRVTAMDPAAAANQLVKAAAKEELIFRDHATGEVLYTGNMGHVVDRNGVEAQLKALLREQKAGKNAFAFLARDAYAYEVELFGGTKAAAVQQWLDSAIYGETERVDPVDAYLEITDVDYRVVEEVVGNAVNTNKCALALMRMLPGYVLGEQSSYTVDVREGRPLPKKTAESAVLHKQMAVLDAYFGTEIVLDFENGNTVTLGLADLMAVSEITVTVGDAFVEPVEEKVAELVTDLAMTYGSHGADRKYLNVEPTREVVYRLEKDPGWEMRIDLLIEQVLEALTSRQDAVITPEYHCTDYFKMLYGFHMDTFLEISLDNQYIWYYLDGRLLTESPVVTGNIARGDYTRRGFFQINWKTANTVLRGPTWEDPVDFWMPFDETIGIHDSSWRDEYGGDIYLTDGSHGCVNTPWEPMSIIFNNIWIGVPVIVY